MRRFPGLSRKNLSHLMSRNVGISKKQSPCIWRTCSSKFSENIAKIFSYRTNKNIFETLDKSYIQKYDKRLNDLKNSKICKKNKFKIMDILEMV